uniref:Uncharacterized protein n=1 Tax=viral metagenome TaxID=1070528 RepID=A0A6H1ZIG3_9ZZZZ
MHVKTEQLCTNLEQATQNRQRVHNHENIHGYLVQEAAREGWAWGQPKPPSLCVGELPVVHPRHYHPFAVWRQSDNQ